MRDGRIKGVGKRVSRFVSPTMEINCPTFDVLHWARGCPFACSYCYLRRTFRRLPDGKAFKAYDEAEVLRHLDAWLTMPGLDSPMGPAALNAGELADSFAGGGGLIVKVMIRFARRESNPFGRYLVLLTKTGDVEGVRYSIGAAVALAGSDPILDRLIVSATLNAPQFAADFESGTPPMEERLRVLESVRDVSDRVRLRVRIDPIDGHYSVGYAWLADRVRVLQPEVVTLGSFRLYPQDRAWFRPTSGDSTRRGLAIARAWEGLELTAGPDGRKRPARRLEWFVDVASMLPGLPVGLCKEPTTTAAEFEARTGRTWAGCNCTPPIRRS